MPNSHPHARAHEMCEINLHIHKHIYLYTWMQHLNKTMHIIKLCIQACECKSILAKQAYVVPLSANMTDAWQAALGRLLLDAPTAA
jgi:hypothetical protein